jgi:hypothetical protein
VKPLSRGVKIGLLAFSITVGGALVTGAIALRAAAPEPERAIAPGLLCVLFVFVAIGWLVFVWAFNRHNLAQKTTSRKAKVVGKDRAALLGVAYHCTFEFEDGQRESYNVHRHQYDSIAEGERGELDTRGALFWDFRRETPSESLSPNQSLPQPGEEKPVSVVMPATGTLKP